MFSAGNVISFSYPTDNRIGVKTRLARRRVVVKSERDLAEQPLETSTIRLDPWRRRGQLLVTGFDLDKQRWRKFYFEPMRTIQVSDQPLMRLGIYDPLADEEPHLYGRPWTDSRADQAEVKRLIKLANQWLIDQNLGKCVSLFPILKSARVSA